MGRTVSIGAQDFGQIRERGCFYVDKTIFIKDWWENEDDVTLITRPRRFGKTLTMSMLDYFFSTKHREEATLFEGLAIWEIEKYRRLQGTYPVISLSFAGVKQTEFKKTYGVICGLLHELYSVHDYLLSDERVSESEREKYLEMKRVLNGEFFDKTLKYSDTVEMALHTLSELLSKCYGRKVLIFLDE